MALVTRHGSGLYVSSEPALQAAREAGAALPKGLFEACLSTGRMPAAGEVKMIYSTKVWSWCWLVLFVKFTSYVAFLARSHDLL